MTLDEPVYGDIPNSKLGKTSLYDTTDMSLDDETLPSIDINQKNSTNLKNSSDLDNYQSNKPLPAIPSKSSKKKN